ncbi:terminase small subunit [Polluticoccus soli]|uniref:terminase small subunit n=1 Tax=Polluticoccus soli TaxID=3034150 RepID=UPI0023E2E457|nr:terminase small subunit [Flavipsychrobacter sp. JY13-12]
MNRKQQAFVCEMLRHGNRAEAYRAAYKPQSDNPRSVESAANRLMKNPEIAEAVQTVQDRIYAEVQEELKARVLHETLTTQRKREILAQIAEGQWIMQPPPDNIEGKPTAVLIPTLKERLRAIDMDNRMTGTYSRKENVEVENEGKDNKTQQSEQPRQEAPLAEQFYDKEVDEPIPGQKRMPFIVPVIGSRNPLLNHGLDKPLLPVVPGMEELKRGNRPWLQTIRV